MNSAGAAKLNAFVLVLIVGLSKKGARAPCAIIV